MVGAEFSFANLQDDMNYVESYVQYLCKWLLEHCREEMEFMVKSHDKSAIERLEVVSSTPFERISYTKVVDILKHADRKFENKVEWGIDLASEHERCMKIFIAGRRDSIRILLGALDGRHQCAGLISFLEDLVHPYRSI